MIKINVKVKGVEKVVANIMSKNMEAEKEAGAGLKFAAKDIMADSKINEVPVDTGTLQSTAFILEPKTTNEGVTVTMGYGGPNDKKNPKSGKMASEYMLEVHENPTYYHPYGKWKFLEDPVRRYTKPLFDILRARLKVVFSKGVNMR